MMRFVRGPEYLEAIERLAARIDPAAWDAVVGVKRSGLFPAVFVSHRHELPFFTDSEVATIPEKYARVLVVDAVVNTGGTLERVRRRLLRAKKTVGTAVLYKENGSLYPVDVHLETATDLVHFFYERLRWTPGNT